MATGAADESVASVERRSPTDVFGLLANEVRISILRALGETPNDGISFSELYDRVDVADSGNFNYHLGELLGVFVRETDGYELTHAGKRIVGAIHAGTYTANATIEALSIGWECGLCGGEMVVSYADERAHFRCVECEEGASFTFPPGSLDQFTRAELPAAFARWWHHLAHQLLDRFCHVCAGRLKGKLVRPPGGTEADPQPSQAAFECRRCGATATVSGSTLATFHPIVEGFLAEHGFDISARHPSQVWMELETWNTVVRSDDPLRLEVRFGHGGEIVIAEIGPDATVEGVERRSAER